MALRVLVVDDTALFRKVIGDALAGLPGVEVVGTASNGKIGLARIDQLKPDLVTLDIEMPEMGGLDVLKAMKERSSPAGAIVLTGCSREGTDLTVRALELGAFDFLTKPAGKSAADALEAFRSALSPIIGAFHRRHEIQGILGRGGAPAAGGAPATATAAAPPRAAPARKPAGEAGDHLARVAERMTRLSGTSRPEMVLIGVSTGGPNALARLLPSLPADLGVPVLIVQHMPPLFTGSLAASLNEKCKIKVKEASDGEAPLAGTAYIAPGGRQMKLSLGVARERILRITDDPPENNCRPAVDYLFRSVANHFPGTACAVILTGMGCDGTLGLRLLKRGGCFTIAQDAASCVVFGMPKEAIEAGVVDQVAPLDGIADLICRTLRGHPA